MGSLIDNIAEASKRIRIALARRSRVYLTFDPCIRTAWLVLSFCLRLAMLLLQSYDSHGLATACLKISEPLKQVDLFVNTYSSPPPRRLLRRTLALALSGQDAIDRDDKRTL